MSKILIIEDEEAIADLEKDYLELSGFEVEIETRGDRGLERALETDYDMYILDLMLPGMTLIKSVDWVLVQMITLQNHFPQVNW